MCEYQTPGPRIGEPSSICSRHVRGMGLTKSQSAEPQSTRTRRLLLARASRLVLAVGVLSMGLALPTALRAAMVPLTGAGLQVGGFVSGVDQVPTEPEAPAALERHLLDQAKYWEDRYNEAASLEALQKLLTINATNEKALFQLGRHKAKGGEIEEARLYVNRLQEAEADPELIERLTLLIRLYQDQGQRLEQARELARQDNLEAALEGYRAIFGNNPPEGELATEFYHTMAGIEPLWDEAVEGLRLEAERSPENRRALFTLAEVLTYREETRREGLTELSRFFNDSVYSDRAQTAYRNGLLWLGGRLEDQPIYEDYLERFPDDGAIQDKLAQVVSPPLIDEATALVNKGYAELFEDKLRAAQASFLQALEENAQDANAHAGLGLTLLRQDDFAGAENAFIAAAQADPEIVPDITDAFNAAAFWRRYHEAERAREEDDLQRAEEILFEIADLELDDARYARQALANVYADIGQYDQSEELFRELREDYPTDLDIAVGYINALREQERFEEAVEVGKSLPGEAREQIGLNTIEALVLRQRADAAKEAGNVVLARRELEAALNLDPTDPWLQLDYAVLLNQLDDVRAADEVMAIMADQVPLENDAKVALSIYASQRGDWDRAIELLQSIPAGERKSGDQQLLGEAIFSRELIRANLEAAAEEFSAARRILAQLQAANPNDTVRLVRIADVYVQAGAPGTAVSLLQRVLRQGDLSQLDADTLLRMSQILGEAGERAEANDLIAELRSRPELPQNLDVELARMRRSSVLERSRALMEEKNYAMSFEALQPFLEPGRANAEILRLAAEIHQRAGFPERAFLYYSEALDYDSRNLDSIRGAVGTAIQTGNIEAASSILDEALSLMPDLPDLYLLVADLAQAAGDKFAAIEALEAARRLQLDFTPGDGASLVRPSAYQYAENTWLGRLERRLAHAGYDTGTMTLAATGPATPVLGASSERRVTSIGDGAMGLGVPMDERLRIRPMALEPSQGASAREDGIRLAQNQNDTEASERIRRLLRRIADDERRREEEQNPSEEVESEPTSGQQGTQSNQSGTRQTPQSQPTNLRDSPLTQTPRRRAPREQVFLEDPSERRRPRSVRSLAGRENILETSSAARFELVTPPRDAVGQRLTDLLWEVDDNASVIAGFRTRSGEAGLSELLELKTDLRYEFGFGQERTNRSRGYVQVTPTFLSAEGDLNTPSQTQRFGAAGTVAGNLTLGSTTVIDEFSAAGIGLEGGIDRGNFHADIGVTPLGFTRVNLVGGVSYTAEVAEKWFLSGELFRRAVTDSTLSYAGANDPTTGESFGAVTRTGGKINLVRDFGRGGVYVGGGLAVYDGVETDTNRYGELTGGFYFYPIQEEQRSLQVGYNTTLFSFEENRRFFTTGHGGYFSPQTFISASVPVEFRGANGFLTYGVNGALGIQFFEEDSAPFYPNDPALTAAATGAIATATASLAGLDFGVDPTLTYAAQEVVQFSYRLGGDVNYRIAEQLELEGRLLVDNAADYTETIGAIGVRYRFGGTGQPN